MYELRDTDRIFIFTGPEGSGRKTVAEASSSTFDMKKVVAYTTRDKRPGETNGHDYHFVSHEEFKAIEATGAFIETVTIHENFYGIKRTDLENQLQEDGSLYIVMNRHGAQMIKNLFGDKAVRFFIYADRETVKKRQAERGLSEETIQRNVIKFNEDMHYMASCEHSFENYDLSYTVMDLTRTIEGYLNRGLLDLD